MAWAPGEGGGGAFQKWASVPGPLFCVRTDVAAKGAATQILARKIFFSRKNVPPHMCSQNDPHDVGIILSHVCWGRPPPPPPARQVGQRQPTPPSRHGDQGGGGGGWRNGLPCHPPPAKQFSSRPGRHCAINGCPRSNAGYQTDVSSSSVLLQDPHSKTGATPRTTPLSQSRRCAPGGEGPRGAHRALCKKSAVFHHR